jgi:glutamate 5-kinase
VERNPALQSVKKIVVKIGSSSLSEGNHISRKKMSRFVDDVSVLIKRGYHVVIVTSGAISAGASRIGKNRSTLSIPEKQALASVGQTILMNEYSSLFLEKSINIGQVLLAEEDVVNRQRFLNARNALTMMLDMGIVPVVNENDTVAVEEIKLGENDTLAAYVAHIVEADLTVLLSDIDGFYMDLSDPAPVPFISAITNEVYAAAGGSGSAHGTGGMFTKIRAADMVIRSGEMMIIAKADIDSVLNRLMDGENIGTLFMGSDKPLDGRKRWIAFNMDYSGLLVIDDGAVHALVEGKKSLLAAGICSLTGSFNQGDAVIIADLKGREIGKGIINYSADEVLRIKGMKTSDIKKMIEDTFYEEVIHRDNMIVF